MRVSWLAAGLLVALAWLAVGVDAQADNVFLYPDPGTPSLVEFRKDVGANDPGATTFIAPTPSGGVFSAPSSWPWNFDPPGSSIMVVDTSGPLCSPNPFNPPTFRTTATTTYQSGTTAPYDTITVTAICGPNNAPDAEFELLPGSARAREAIQFTDRSTDPDQAWASPNPIDPLNVVTQWRWDFGDNHISNLRDPTHAYDQAGTYEVTLVVTDAYGAPSAPRTRSVIINPPPRPDRTGAEFPVAIPPKDFDADEGSTVRLVGRSSGPSPVVFTWRQLLKPEDPVVNLTNINSPTATFTAPMLVDGEDIYLTFGLTATHRSLDSEEQYVSVHITTPNTPPRVRLTPEVQNAVEGSDVLLSANGTVDLDGDPIQYRWVQVSGPQMPLNGTRSRDLRFNAPAYRPEQPPMVFRLEASDGRFVATDNATVRIIPLSGSLGNATFVSSVVTGMRLSFTTDAPGDIVWDFGDGSPGAVGSTVNHTFARPGPYLVKMISSSPAGVRTARETINVAAPPAPTSAGATSTGSPFGEGSPAPFPWLFVSLAAFAVALVAVGLFVVLRGRKA